MLDLAATGTVADAAGALARLGALELDGLSDDDLTAQVLRMQELRGALEAAEARVLGEWDRRKVWRADGAKAGAAWLASRQRLPMSEARRRLRHARAVRRFPAVAQAWASGAIDRTHLTTLMGACTPRTEAAFERGHLLLLDSARTRGFADFTRHRRTGSRSTTSSMPRWVDPPLRAMAASPAASTTAGAPPIPTKGPTRPAGKAAATYTMFFGGWSR